MKKLLMIMAMVAVIGMAGVANATSILWLKADAIQGLADNDPVVTWTDSSGNGNSPTTTLGAPIYKTGIAGGKPVVRFAGGGHRMSAPDDPSLDAASWTVFSVMQYGNLAVTECMMFKGATDTTFGVMGYSTNGATVKRDYTWVRHEDGGGISDQASVQGGTDFGVTAFHVHTGWFDKTLLPDNTSNPAAINLYRDGTLDIAGSPYHLAQAGVTLDPICPGPLQLGWTGAEGDPRYFEGDIAEIAILGFAASGQEILDVNAYLGDKYGITVEGGGNAAAGRALLPAAGPVIPEPAGLGLIGLALLAVRRRRS